MNKYLIAQTILSCIILLTAGCRNNAGENKTEHLSSPYTTNDLQKIRWIEGKWKGMYDGKPFYEIYNFINDSTLEITGYEWDGKDSSKSSKSYLSWTKDAYFLGNEMNYKVIRITDTEIEMAPNYKASNSVLWKKNETGWTAILEGSKKSNVYDMLPFDPFQK